MPWTGPTFQMYYLEIERRTWAVVNQERPDYLLQVGFDEYLEYLVAEASWKRLDWHEDQMTIEPISVKRRLPDRYGGHAREVDTQLIRIRIPTSPHPRRDEYLRYGPSKTRGSQPAWRFEGDVLVLEVEATEQAVQGAVEDVRFWLGNRNEEIEAGNAKLRDRIHAVWEMKRRQVEEQRGAMQVLIEKLNIPLHQDPSAKAKPVEIKPRHLRTVMEKPRELGARTEPALDREEVASLVDFIEQYLRQFEVAPETYSAMDEEKLRNLLVGMMNANYPGSTTAETFSKLGKTDISLRIDSGHVLVCECKFWSGAKAYGDALNQLFGYLTWRQNYGVLIGFCRLKDMSKAVFGAKKATSEHSAFAQGALHERSETRFISRHVHPQDTSKLVEIHHLFVDLTI